MKRVYRAATLPEVAHARNLLTAAGIPSEIRNQFLAGAAGDLPMFETWPQLLVDEIDEARARAGRRRAPPPGAGGGWASRGSRARGAPQVTPCWRCGLEADAPPP